MSKIKRFRFDDQFGSIYEYDDDQKGYMFVGNYLNAGIKARMSETTKIRRAARMIEAREC